MKLFNKLKIIQLIYHILFILIFIIAYSHNMIKTSFNNMHCGCGGGGDTALAQFMAQEHINHVTDAVNHVALGCGNSIACYIRYLCKDIFNKTEFSSPEEETQIKAIHKNLTYKGSFRKGFSAKDSYNYICNILKPTNTDIHYIHNQMFQLNKYSLKLNADMASTFSDGTNNGVYNSLIEEMKITSREGAPDTYMLASVGGIGDKYITSNGKSITKDNVRSEILKSVKGLFEFIVSRFIDNIELYDVGGDIIDKIMTEPLETWGRDEIMILSILIIMNYRRGLTANVHVIGPGVDAHKHPQLVVNKLVKIGFKRNNVIGDKLYSIITPEIESDANPYIAETLFRDIRATKIFYNSKKLNRITRQNSSHPKSVELKQKIVDGLSGRREKGYKPVSFSHDNYYEIGLMASSWSMILNDNILKKSRYLYDEFKTMNKHFKEYIIYDTTEPEGEELEY